MRIMIIGGPGSGKSTLARRLGQGMGLPVFHLDRYQFQPGWVEADPQDRDATLRELAAQDRWVIDGNYAGTWDIRVPRADLVIWLDLPVGLRLWRVVRRSWTFRGQVRPDLADGCPEVFDWHSVEFYWYVVRTSRSYRRKVLTYALPLAKRVVHLTSQAQIDAFKP